MTRHVFRLPDLGEGLTEAEIVDWKVSVGDTVEIDQIVVEVETAKAAVEVPVPYAGTVLSLNAPAGTVLSVGEPLIEVGPARGAGGSAAAERYREEERAGSGNVLIGYGTGHTPTNRRRRTPRKPPTTQPHTAPGSMADELQAPRVISPLVRRLAHEHGVDLAAVTPTGPRGVILRRDVESAIAALSTSTVSTIAAAAVDPATPRATETAAPATQPNSDPIHPISDPTRTTPIAAGTPLRAERIPLRGLRRAVADKLSRSRTEIPDATTWVDVDATGLLEVKDALRRDRPDLGIGLLALLARVCVAALRRFPELNSSVDTARAEIVRHGHVNLGFAAQTDRGLVVPVVRDAHLMSTAQLAAELTRLTALAREGTLPPAALTGGTFTLNNYGVFGVDGSTPIINHPEAALLGVGRIIDRPWVRDGAVVPRKVTQLSFTFDHRVCDGGAAGGFLRFVADCVENPAILLAHA
ncbi:dihydrolipoamide acetyltransferase family protein [Nonomuraea angiospora]|uniref:Dihydrolipoamide acetyltransferase component of pyruvate dehydrogenase complex n=1 Tax=Nonomuraea angiospora TaxID=46172 RepID=A0ABR9LPA4_9ACTN|nr:dihydrolipoamide acetyltransferase family protein [Nonomuraea angiospora]MBE1582488.1 pyruvate dehydrogenase E2 component (dihydrolipoamide acetyltransferase) [Nonomuraea angiospora]